MEHLLCYVTDDGKEASFVWARPRDQKTTELRALPYEVGSPARTTPERIAALAFPLEELGLCGEPTPTAVADKRNAAFDVESVTKELFREYREVFEQTEAAVKGVPKGDKRRLNTQRLLNRLMFLWFIQKKGWMSIDGDGHYLRALFNAAEAAVLDVLLRAKHLGRRRRTALTRGAAEAAGRRAVPQRRAVRPGRQVRCPWIGDHPQRGVRRLAAAV